MTSAPRDRRPSWTILPAVALASGLVLAIVALPAIGSFAFAASRGVNAWRALPDDLPIALPAARTTILAADGSLIASLYDQNRILVSLEEVPKALQDAVVAIEDERFYQHHGVDGAGLVRAALANRFAGKVTQGGSTLTQQYVKNLLLMQAQDENARSRATERTMGRKLREMRYSLALERKLTKQQILENYLNIAYFGAGAYGAGAAAYTYFGKPVSQLTVAECALLAGMLHSPAIYDPRHHKQQAATNRRDLVLDRMAEQGYISTADAQYFKHEPLQVQYRPTPNGCDQAGSAAFFCDYVRRYLESEPTFGRTQQERRARLFAGGLTVRTTLDPRAQKIAQDQVDRRVGKKSDFAAAVVTVEPGTGKVLAMAVNRTFGQQPGNPSVTEVPLASEPFTSSGSTFKAFTLAAALEKGVPLGWSVFAPAHLRTGYAYQGKPFVVDNAGDSESGTFDLRSGTWSSVNTFYYKLQNLVGVKKVAEMASRVGVTSVPLEKVTKSEVSFTLGAREVSPLEMATAYATFAADGLRCDPHPIASVAGHKGEFPALGSPCRQVIDEDVAASVTNVLRGVLTRGTAEGHALDRPAAGKTGTTNNHFSAWFVGYTPQLSTAVMISDPDLPRRPLEDVTIGGEHYDKMYGGSLAAPMWHDVMTQMDTELKLPAKGFNQQSADFDDGRDVKVPDVASMSYLEAIDRLEAAGFAAKLSDQVARSSQPIGNVAGSVPGAGTRAPYGQSVAIVLSGGPNGADLADIGRPAKPTPSPGTPSPVAPSTAPPGAGAGRP